MRKREEHAQPPSEDVPRSISASVGTARQTLTSYGPHAVPQDLAFSRALPPPNVSRFSRSTRVSCRANCCPPRTTSHGRKNPTRPIAAGVDTSYIHCSQLGGFPTHPLTRGVMRALFFLFFFCFFLFVCLNNYAASLVPYTNAVCCWRCGVHKFDVDRGVRVCIWMGRMQSTTKQKQSLADVCDHNGSPKFLSFFFNSSSLHST